MKYTKLTPKLINLLQRMKNNPNIKIHQSWASYKYYLKLNRNFIKTGERGSIIQYEKLNFDAFHFLEIFFTKEQDKDYQENIYSLRPDAQLTDEWRLAELGKQRMQKDKELAAKLLCETSKAKKASSYFGSGFYRVEISGVCPFSGSIYAGDTILADITPAIYSTSDKTFEDILRYPKNVEHFDRIKLMLESANVVQTYQEAVCACHSGSICTKACDKGIHHDGCGGQK